MPDGIKFSELQSTLTLGNNDLAAVSHDNGDSTYTSVKVPMTQLGQKVVNDIDYTQALNTTSKKPIGAINELKNELMNIYPVLATSPAPIANFNTDLALPLKACNVEIKPKQASGTPTPSSPLPISGTDTIKVYQTGANLWDEQWELGAYADTTGLPTASDNRIRCKNFIPVKPNTTYYFAEPLSIRVFNYGLTQDNDYLGYSDVPVSGVNARLYTAPSGCHFIRFRMGSSANPVTTYNNDISINYPSTDTTYHAHVTATTKTVSLPQTVYGGYLDLDSGVLTITHAGETINFSDKLSSTNLGDCSRVAFALQNAPQNINTDLCSVATYTYNYNLDSPHFYCVVTGGNNRLYLFIDNDDTVDTFQVCYKLATPVSIQLTPEEVNAISGVNNVFGDTDGNTSVEYRESVQKYVDDNIAAVQALIL